jgi:hypothetical protein
MNASQLHELGEKIEEIEHQQFGEDGFDDAVKQITSIEGALDLGRSQNFHCIRSTEIVRLGIMSGAIERFMWDVL